MRWKKILPITVLYAVLLACGERASDTDGREFPFVPNEGTRTYRHETWDTLFEVRSRPHDTLFVRPLEIAVGTNRVYVVDVGKQRIVAFDTTGVLVWSYGRRGDGPDEFANIVDVEVDDEGSLWISDAGLARITALNENGERIHSIRTTSVPFHIAVLDDSSVLSTDVSDDRLFVAFDRKGEHIAVARIPRKKLTEVQPRLRQMFTASNSFGSSWAVASPTISEFFVYRVGFTRPLCGASQVELPLMTPELLPNGRPKVWMYSMSASQDSLHLLSRGSSGESRKTVDVYALRDCKYLFSYILPRQATAIGVLRHKVFITYDDSLGPGVLGIAR